MLICINGGKQHISISHLHDNKTKQSTQGVSYTQLKPSTGVLFYCNSLESTCLESGGVGYVGWVGENCQFFTWLRAVSAVTSLMRNAVYNIPPNYWALVNILSYHCVHTSAIMMLMITCVCAWKGGLSVCRFCHKQRNDKFFLFYFIRQYSDINSTVFRLRLFPNS